ncbi:hypothetical protein R4I97_07080 [Brachyspira pilosicoli]|uniref:hypothetical protein n=1 Tax=Brachyspira pilosicoli TaxID=52584 RepID=UPI003006AA36
MNDFMAKVKNYFSSNFGKLSLIIMGLSFIFTFLFSTLFRNRIDVSIIRAFISTVITGIILYILAIVLKKFLSDAIESSGVFDSNTNNNQAGNNEGIGEIKENTNDIANTPTENTNDENKTFESSSADINAAEDLKMEDNNAADNNIVPSIDNINVDKNKKVDYHNMGDIGDIISSVTDNSNVGESSDYFPLRKESADAVSLEREVKEDPEKVAKAVRTMLSKEEKKESK